MLLYIVLWPHLDTFLIFLENWSILAKWETTQKFSWCVALNRSRRNYYNFETWCIIRVFSNTHCHPRAFTLQFPFYEIFVGDWRRPFSVKKIWSITFPIHRSSIIISEGVTEYIAKRLAQWMLSLWFKLWKQTILKQNKTTKKIVKRKIYSYLMSVFMLLLSRSIQLWIICYDLLVKAHSAFFYVCPIDSIKSSCPCKTADSLVATFVFIYKYFGSYLPDVFFPSAFSPLPKE